MKKSQIAKVLVVGAMSLIFSMTSHFGYASYWDDPHHTKPEYGFIKMGGGGGGGGRPQGSSESYYSQQLSQLQKQLNELLKRIEAIEKKLGITNKQEVKTQDNKDTSEVSSSLLLNAQGYNTIPLSPEQAQVDKMNHLLQAASYNGLETPSDNIDLNSLSLYLEQLLRRLENIQQVMEELEER